LTNRDEICALGTDSGRESQVNAQESAASRQLRLTNRTLIYSDGKRIGTVTKIQTGGQPRYRETLHVGYRRGGAK
jgi:hypothetical protein